MLLYIHDNRTLKELQDEFSLAFPYLRLEFFSKSHAAGVSSAEKNKLNVFMKLIAVRVSHRNGAVEIEDWHSVKSVEQMLQDDYMLPVQIFHFTSAGWIETTVTDEVTLKELNEQGQNAADQDHQILLNTRSLK